MDNRKRDRAGAHAAEDRLSTVYIFSHRRRAVNPRDFRSSVRQMLETACVKASVSYGRGKGITFHGMRHTGASRMLAQHVNPRVVMEIGNWKSLRQLTRYTHPTDTERRQAVEMVGSGRRLTIGSRNTRRVQKRA